jgi:para-nitrobenzyl esterase
MQPDSPNSAGQAKSEDCLYLNVWSPDADDRRRPVMVWLHGGAFAFGSGSESMYDGTSFALAGDVVVVTLNYRLGAFGFLYLGESGLDRYAGSGNCGLLDQIAALRWVRDNIQSFGGDPHQVTVFGESAGAISILNLLAMPEAKGLFHRAIIESPSRAALEAEQAAANARSLLSALNVRMDDIGKLVQIPAEALLKASSAFPQMSFCPVADGITIPERPDAAIPKGEAKDIPVLIGSNQEEYRFFTGVPLQASGARGVPCVRTAVCMEPDEPARGRAVSH